MKSLSKYVLSGLAFLMFAGHSSAGQTLATSQVKVDWTKQIAVSRSTPALQVVVNPMLLRGAKMHDGSFAALHALGADYVRYVPWLPYPNRQLLNSSRRKTERPHGTFAISIRRSTTL